MTVLLLQAAPLVGVNYALRIDQNGAITPWMTDQVLEESDETSD